MSFYFERFEDRTPPEPLPYAPVRELLWQFLATICLVLGGAYIWWRWTASLNMEALWFAIPLVVAETGAYIGLILFVINLWKVKDWEITPPPADIVDVADGETSRPIVVDVMFATYNEDPELVRLGIRDAKRIEYPHPIDIRIHVLDDGRRPAMQAVSEEEGVGYITRTSNEGFKAGNLRNAMERTSGDFLVICDADTRPFPTILSRTLGYFRDRKLAWVQTPQWFYDLPEGRSLEEVLERRIGGAGRWIGKAVQRVTGPLRFGEDPFTNDPRMFYDVILRRRNWANAAFCCGAGSIHRREAVMEAALRSYGERVDASVQTTSRQFLASSRERRLDTGFSEALRSEAAVTELLTPYKFHVSEDIYTSIVLHSDRERGWKSVLHPYVESRMLSPQDLLTWTIQRFKYAGGSLDILFHDNPLFRRGLTLPQRLMYGSTFWSYLGGIWNFAFLLAPIVYLFTAAAPVSAYSTEFFLRILPFLICLELATMVGTWGIPGYQAKSSYLSFFPVNLRALWTVLRGKKISFPVTPKDRQTGRHLRIVWPQMAIIGLTLAGMAFALGLYLLGNDDYSLAGILANSFWGLNNCLALAGIVRAAMWQPEESEQ